MKRTCLSFLCALLAVGIGVGSVRAEETTEESTQFESSLVAPAVPSDSSFTFGKGSVRVKGEEGGSVELEMSGIMDTSSDTLEPFNGEIFLVISDLDPINVPVKDGQVVPAEADEVVTVETDESVAEEDDEGVTEEEGEKRFEKDLGLPVGTELDLSRVEVRDSSDQVFAVPGVVVIEGETEDDDGKGDGDEVDDGDGDNDDGDNDGNDDGGELDDDGGGNTDIEDIVIENCTCGDKTGDEWKNHGEFVSCVAQATDDPDLIKEAAQSNCGKSNK